MQARSTLVFDNKENINPNVSHDKKPAPLALQRSFIQTEPQDVNNPIHLYYYAQEIYSYLYSVEKSTSPQYGYMKKQVDVNERMRSILVDWLIEVHQKFDLVPETLFLAINIIDRFLEKQNIVRNILQLAGVSALFLACKYEEIYAPVAQDLVIATDRAYTKDQIITMERNILKTLDYRITAPSSLRFLYKYAKLLNLDEKGFSLARYLLELSLLDYKMIRFNPSNIAASAVYLAKKILKIEIELTEDIVRNVRYNENELKACAKDLCVLAQNAKRSSLQSVYKKFSLPKFHGVSLLL